MNHLAMSAVLRSGTDEPSGAGTQGAVAAAVTAVERCLAEAYDRGDSHGVRLLHAVLGLLAALPGGDGPAAVRR